MSVTRKRTPPTDLAPYAALAALTALVLIVAATWLAMRAGAAISHHAPPPANPFSAVTLLAVGRAPWPGTAATAIAAAEAVGTAALAAAVLLVIRRRPARHGIDRAVPHLATKSEQADLTAAGAGGTAVRLGVQSSRPGVRIGHSVGTGEPLYGTWEMTHADIWGARMGKTTSRVIPAILDAPGAVVATSNKRDVADATRLPREKAGHVWVFDPQSVVGESAAWWWNPLTYVTDIDHAARLAAIFANFSRAADARQDAYFDPEGEALLSFLILAAAIAGEPITKVYEWTTDPTQIRPANILRAAGHELPAQGIDAVIGAPDRQRAGVYGTAKKNVSFLVNPDISRWVTPAGEPDRPQFSPTEFVAGTGTLYLLSVEGQGTAGPLVTALTVATIEAASQLATRSPSGRLPVPLLCVLDEAANVCRWRDLPDLYSHFGSRGITLMTLLQNWSQGVTVWGKDGMAKLWSAANIRVYGGGEADTWFLGNLSQLLGHYEPVKTSVNVQHGHWSSRSTTTSTQVEKVLEVADLAAMPRGRALVFASGMKPVLIETEPWQSGPHRAAVRASLDRYAPGPAGTSTGDDAPLGGASAGNGSAGGSGQRIWPPTAARGRRP